MINFVKNNKFCFIAALGFIVVGILQHKANINLSDKSIWVLHFIVVDIGATIAHFMLEMLLLIPYYMMVLNVDFPFLQPLFVSITLFVLCLFCKKSVNDTAEAMFLIYILCMMYLFIKAPFDLDVGIIIDNEIAVNRRKEDQPRSLEHWIMYCNWVMFYLVSIICLYLKFNIRLLNNMEKKQYKIVKIK